MTTRKKSQNTKKGELTVKSVRWRGHLKEVTFGKSKRLLVSRSACVTVGDRVTEDRHGVYVNCLNGAAKIWPEYRANAGAQVGSYDFPLEVKEITTEAEFEACRALSDLHYRSEALFGKNARLVVRSFHPSYPEIVGFIDLCSPLYMNKARNGFLNTPIALGPISWSTWDMASMRKYINVLVRIARCVVLPEFRGIGLGTLLANHAAAFAKERWHVGGIRPQFIEISADMLRYVPFAERAGMVYVGETEGNLNRVAKDMAYLLKNRRRVSAGEIVREDACGIVDQQVSRMQRAAQIAKQNKWNLDEFIRQLETVSQNGSLRRLHIFNEILSFPKPTYLRGLTSEADQIVMKRQSELGISNASLSATDLSGAARKPASVRMTNVGVAFKTQVQRTQRTFAIQKAFGISPHEFSQPVLTDFNFEAQGGEVVLITGSSGCGKSTLLKLLSRSRLKFTGAAAFSKDYRPGVLAPIRSKKPLIDVLSATDASDAMSLLGLVGLSDAFVYLKRFEELSTGQQYRAMIAKLISERKNVWLVDEFGTHLDQITALFVASRIRHIATRSKIIVFVATSQPENIAAALSPDQVVTMSLAGRHSIQSGGDYSYSQVPPSDRRAQAKANGSIARSPAQAAISKSTSRLETPDVGTNGTHGRQEGDGLYCATCAHTMELLQNSKPSGISTDAQNERTHRHAKARQRPQKDSQTGWILK